jgi:uncharacterized protein with HEPN domain
VRDDPERLRDIVEAAGRIAERVQRGRAVFDADEDVQLALVRLIEIVGEACAGLSQELRRRYPHVPWRAAAAMRNRVIHGYFDVDLDLVWAAAEREVPALSRAAGEVLDELTSEGEIADGAE